MNKHLPVWVLLACLGGGVPAFAQAGPLSLFAIVEDHEVRGGVTWADNRPAKNMQVDVLGPDGKSIGMARTDSEGHFRFLPAKRVDHTLVVDDGEGHFANFMIPASRLPKEPLLVGLPKPASAGSAAKGDAPKIGKAPPRGPVAAEILAPPPGYKAAPPPEKQAESQPLPSAPASGEAPEQNEAIMAPSPELLDRAAVTEIVRAVVAEEMVTALSSLESRLDRYERRGRMTDILAFFGAILGIAGAGFWMSARHMLRMRDILQKPPEGSMVDALPAGEKQDEQKETP